jgi:hypothetical protein
VADTSLLSRDSRVCVSWTDTPELKSSSRVAPEDESVTKDTGVPSWSNRKDGRNETRQLLSS